MISPDLNQPVDEIFNQGVLPVEPLIYVCSPTKTDASLAPEGCEVVYVLCIVPNLQGKPDWSKDIPEFRRRVFDRMRMNGVDIRDEDIEVERHLSPKDFETRYGNMHGTAFGLAPDFFQSAAFRPQIKSKDIPGLYHVGASTHPGGGIPMVLTCGRLAAEEVDKNFKQRVFAN